MRPMGWSKGMVLSHWTNNISNLISDSTKQQIVQGV